MPLFKAGSFGQIGVLSLQSAKVVKPEHKNEVKLSRLLSVDAMAEVSFNIESPKLELAKSDKRWGLYLKKLSLYESFEGFIVNAFNPKNELYFTSIAWDYSGAPPIVYPPKDAPSSNLLIPMTAKTTREFIGNGVSLWPSQQVIGALNVIFLIYESDQDVRDVGDVLVNIHDAVQNSQLASLVSVISTNPALATGIAIGTAVNDLLGVIGKIMKNDRNDFVDMFEGSYGTDKPQNTRTEKYNQEAAGIELDLTVS